MNRHNVLLGLLVVCLIVIWLDVREAATALLLVIGVLVWRGQRAERSKPVEFHQWLEAQTDGDEDIISYSQLILTAMGWAASGKTVYVPEDEDPRCPRIIYVGHRVPSALGQGQTFLPELAITERDVQPLDGLGRVGTPAG